MLNFYSYRHHIYSRFVFRLSDKMFTWPYLIIITYTLSLLACLCHTKLSSLVTRRTLVQVVLGRSRCLKDMRWKHLTLERYYILECVQIYRWEYTAVQLLTFFLLINRPKSQIIVIFCIARKMCQVLMASTLRKTLTKLSNKHVTYNKSPTSRHVLAG